MQELGQKCKTFSQNQDRKKEDPMAFYRFAKGKLKYKYKIFELIEKNNRPTGDVKAAAPSS